MSIDQILTTQKTQIIQTFLNYFSYHAESCELPIVDPNDQFDVAIVTHVTHVRKHVMPWVDENHDDYFRWIHNIVHFSIQNESYCTCGDTTSKQRKLLQIITYSYDLRHQDVCFIISTVMSLDDNIPKLSTKYHDGVFNHFAAQHWKEEQEDPNLGTDCMNNYLNFLKRREEDKLNELENKKIRKLGPQEKRLGGAHSLDEAFEELMNDENND